MQQKSPAEFFAENKNIAGFDNPGKCLYTTVRELVENSLDAAESSGNLPDVEVTIEEISQKRMNTIRGIANLERVDETLYQDFETEDLRKKRMAKEAREQEKLMKAAQKAEVKRAAAASKSTKTFYKVTVKDNGTGMPHKDIPNLLGRVLSGTKYGLQQTRGKFGLGAKMALIWSKMSTGLPIEVWSARQGQSFISYYKLDIDIHKNEPNVHKTEEKPNPDRWHGAELSVTILGNWQYYRAKIHKYLRQIAVITPYAKFSFAYVAEDEKNSIRINFTRRTDKMPAPPKEVKYHPASVDLELIKRLIAVTKCSTLRQFLYKDFSSISKDYAGMPPHQPSRFPMPLHSLSQQCKGLLHQLLHEAKFKDPDKDHLSPAGEYNLRLGILKELNPELVATHQGDARVLEGHAFVVEAAVSVGGRDIKPGINVYRFANRIPLLFEGGSDVITRTALKRINWANYKINQTSDKVGVFVSIVSTKIPYKGAGKEYIADDMDEMVHAVKHALQQCCLQLKVKITKQQAAKEQKLRRKNLIKYVPNAAAAVFKVLQTMSETPAVGPKRRRMETDNDILGPVKRREVEEGTLVQRLTEYVERIDTDMALEYQMQQGMAEGMQQPLFLMPQTALHSYGPPLQGTACTVCLLSVG
ncbi:hypothetical protein COCSUDRAFT_11853 [Coccomyxa subellipsoidea C-169]|uniref:DNA topoisomerase 6 subunit B n=1 Tax=Coccomyxa subellipsoidea (strain C-169) TaxID=574566 RepID=I0Z7T5_COCSC|nr:hypothetical protein COCSUDRAFT_11853 [Coccomyxa subellipsoidea C-169]EIE26704.1 hypothetical protein COCSUDRAFT_11853 [Coccomyxa subellipsoidea C-169]|eukprot:XP_005651248.1 hypothetical protein COCSUDRAFT_11853 [Coccomyxa subellipsoidea C-169]